MLFKILIDIFTIDGLLTPSDNRHQAGETVTVPDLLGDKHAYCMFPYTLYQRPKMTNSLTLIASSVTAWTTKAGKTQEAHTATAARRAPAKTQNALAVASDLTAWKNGQFRPLLADLRAMVPAGAQAFLPDGADKVTAYALINAVAIAVLAPKADKNGIVKPLTGHKARMRATVDAILSYELERAALKAAGVEPAADVPAADVPAADVSALEQLARDAQEEFNAYPAANA